MKETNDSSMKYWFKQLVERPSSFVALVCIIAVSVIYNDYKGMKQTQMEINIKTVVAIEKLTEEVRVNSVEIAHLQHELATMREDRKKKESQEKKKDDD